ncbi:MAG: tetratricopeptide repeat protein, partial [Segetibacter sp.]|nr:tetratricopeptide repeat protein [Segetibacter sp.]
MKKLTTLVLMVLFTGKLVLAQSVDEAKRFLYYDRVTSAKQTLEKIVSSNPKN